MSGKEKSTDLSVSVPERSQSAGGARGDADNEEAQKAFYQNREHHLEDVGVGQMKYVWGSPTFDMVKLRPAAQIDHVRFGPNIGSRAGGPRGVAP
jgi:hypothetical protein